MTVGALMQVQEVWLEGTRYLLLEGGSIVAENWSGELGYAHLNEDGSVMRHGTQIARISDMQFGNVLALPLDAETVFGMIDTIIGDEEVTA